MERLLQQAVESGKVVTRESESDEGGSRVLHQRSSLYQ